MSEPAKLQVCQIQVQPVDNGFAFQVANLDGVRKSVKRIATDVPDLREQLHTLIDVLYEPPPATPTAPTPDVLANSGQIGAESLTGTQAEPAGQAGAA